MMSNAEQRALEVYPKDIEEWVDVNGVKSVVDNNSWQRAIFLKGYHQAEKDLELIWEDIDTIYNLLCEEFNYQLECGKRPQKEACQEVLKRFKGMKNNEDNQDTSN